MKNIFFILILFVVSLGDLNSQELLPEDKQAHIIAGACAGIPFYFFNKSHLKVKNTWWNVALTTAEGAAIGWAFEHYQKSTGRGVYDNADILATATGFASGALLGRLLEHDPERYHRKTQRREKRLQEQLKKAQKKDQKKIERLKRKNNRLKERREYYEKVKGTN